jgi:hypothetical protein
LNLPTQFCFIDFLKENQESLKEILVLKY